MISVFITAFALMLIMEGILPFISPNKWREMMAMVFNMKTSEIRLLGLTSMITGLIILFFISL